MSTAQRLRTVKYEIARIERFLPVMKRVLTVLRVEIRGYRDVVAELDAREASLANDWQPVAKQPLAIALEHGVSAEVVTRRASLIGCAIDRVVSVNPHVTLDPIVADSSELAAAIVSLALERARTAERLRVERRNLTLLEEAEEEFVFLINGNEQVRLPPLHAELARLRRALDEEHAMAATIARILREATISGDHPEPEQQWQLFA